MLGVQALRQRANPTLGSTVVLNEAVEATRRLLEADYVTVLQVAADSNELAVLANSPAIDEPRAVPAGSRSFAGYVALVRKVIIVDNISNDRRFEACPMGPHFRTGSAVGAPIFGPAGVRGVLTAETSMPNRFDHGVHHFIQGVANVVGMALLD